MNRILLRIADKEKDKDKKQATNMDNDINIEEDDDINININMNEEENEKGEEDNEDNEKDEEEKNEEFENDEDKLDLDDDNRSMLEQMITEDPFADDDFNHDSSIQPKNNMQNQLIENIFHNLSQDGRGILKHIEDYRFKLIQSLNILNGQEELKKKIEQKQKILESAAAQIYGIVFDLENYHLTPNYEEEQFAGESLPETENAYNEDAFANINNGKDINEIDEQESADLDEEETNAKENDAEVSEDNSTELQGGFDEEDLMEEEK